MDKNVPGSGLFGKIGLFVRKNAGFILIIAIGLVVMWANDTFIYDKSERFSMLVYPIALLLLYFLYLVVRTAIWLFKVFMKGPSR
ncbi:MAG: hypothetical protein JW919_07000 [Candidatus Omnitrophica bacterium]|nr:hypothetical protein [Candidatus Omnitrophota bacterium]